MTSGSRVEMPGFDHHERGDVLADLPGGQQSVGVGHLEPQRPRQPEPTRRLKSRDLHAKPSWSAIPRPILSGWTSAASCATACDRANCTDSAACSAVAAAFSFSNRAIRSIRTASGTPSAVLSQAATSFANAASTASSQPVNGSTVSRVRKSLRPVLSFAAFASSLSSHSFQSRRSQEGGPRCPRPVVWGGGARARAPPATDAGTGHHPSDNHDPSRNGASCPADPSIACQHGVPAWAGAYR